MPTEIEGRWLRKLRPGRPLLEAWILSAVIVSVSNVLAQFIDANKNEEPFTFDLPRLLRFLCLDLITAPLNYKWQELLEGTWPTHWHSSPSAKYQSIPLEDRDVEKNSGTENIEDNEDGREGSSRHRSTQPKTNTKTRKHRKQSSKKHWKNIWTKWLVDCITLGAIANTFAFLVIMGFLNGQPQNIPHNLRTRTIPIILNGYKIWPFANIVAQAYVPFERRIVFFATVALFWNIYLSLVAATL